MMEKDSSSELYTTLKGEGSLEFEEKRSLFICHGKHVTNEEDAMAFIKSKKKEYADATHNCWAYILRGGTVARYSDDGEPQGTAGMPMLEAIRKSGVCDAVAVVTRYFGGVLLGAGGLVRAYSHGSALALEAAGIVTYESYAVMHLACSYSDYQKYSVMLLQYNAVIDSTDFSDRVDMCFAVKKTLCREICEKVTELSGAKDHVDIIGERFDYR